MKRLIALVTMLMLISFTAFAVEREFLSDTGNTGGHTSKNVNQPGQSSFERIGVSGSQSAGNSGFIAFNVADKAGVYQPYYLWVSPNGNLCLASYPTISTYSSFPTGAWNSSSMGCTAVGGQTAW